MACGLFGVNKIHSGSSHEFTYIMGSSTSVYMQIFKLFCPFILDGVFSCGTFLVYVSDENATNSVIESV
jgi:hypothetical protein